MLREFSVQTSFSPENAIQYIYSSLKFSQLVVLLDNDFSVQNWYQNEEEESRITMVPFPSAVIAGKCHNVHFKVFWCKCQSFSCQLSLVPCACALEGTVKKKKLTSKRTLKWTLWHFPAISALRNGTIVILKSSSIWDQFCRMQSQSVSNVLCSKA